ncbi:MAG: CHAT domain-containing protein [Cyanobacteria bacterium P01_F01_bin.42]
MPTRSNSQKHILFCLRILLQSAALLFLPGTGFMVALAEPSASVDQGQRYYQAGRYPDALLWLQEELRKHREQGDRNAEAATLSNLALVYSELGEWKKAKAATHESRALINQMPARQRSEASTQQLLAQVLNTHGELQLKQGEVESALNTWKAAERQFEALADHEGRVKSRLNQAHALQYLGFYRRSLVVLNELETDIRAEAQSIDKAARLRRLGIAFGKVGNSKSARKAIEQSIAISRRVRDDDALAQSLIALGNLMSSRGDHAIALKTYAEAWSQSALPSTTLSAKLNSLRSRLELGEWEQAHQDWPELLESTLTRPATSITVQAQLSLAHSLQQLRSRQPSASLSPVVIGRLLSDTRQKARTIGDRRLESYALGKLGSLYEDVGQYQNAELLTQEALRLVDVQSTGEVAYQWQWQLGRIARQRGNVNKAIAFYGSAVGTLGELRRNIASGSRDQQFDFRDRVAPLYQEYVALLLNQTKPNSQDLEKARLAIESLQLAELDNYFRSACLDTTSIAVEEIDQSAAVIYPIVLQDRLAVIVQLPGKPLTFHTSETKQDQVERLVDRLRLSLSQPNSGVHLRLSQQLYDALLRPAIADIEASQIKTLVFVPTGELRNIPLGALHNGKHFVIKDYAVSTTPGLQLLQSGKKDGGRSRVLIAGITEPQGSFPPLPRVYDEVSGIASTMRNSAHLNQQFTQKNLEKSISARPFPIIHLATHGRFSSDLEDTFLLAWNGEKIDIERLRKFLRDSELRYQSSLELLVLSACETALGDNRATLGLAGIAARSGAKSTLASLWRVDDEATAIMMTQFYAALANRTTGKAEALRQAQQFMLNHPTYGEHPYYWSAFVLVGDWQ